MPAQLLVNVVSVNNLAAGASITLPHGLASNDLNVAPTLILPDRATPIVVTGYTNTTVTFRNDGAGVESANFRCERGWQPEVDAFTVTPMAWQGAPGGGGGGAPTNAQYLTLAADGTLTAERIFSPSANFTATDGGAGGNYALDLSNTAVVAGAYTNANITVDAKGRITLAASGGPASDFALPDNERGTWGTTSPEQAYSVFSPTGTGTFTLATTDTVNAVKSSDIVVVTGSNTTVAVLGGGSGNLELRSGATDTTGAGGGGNTGAVAVVSGNATGSGAGVGGSTGSVVVSSGDSDEAQSGVARIRSGVAGTNSGDVFVNSGNATTGKSGDVVIFTGTGVTKGEVLLQARTILNDGVTGGDYRVAGGRAFSSTVDSSTIVGNGAFQTFDVNYTIPANTLKAGSVVRITGTVLRTGQNAADNIEIAVLIGGGGAYAFGAAPAPAASRCFFDACITARANPGAAVSCLGSGSVLWAGQPVGAFGSNNALATNGPLIVSVRCNMPNNAANTAVLQQLVVTIT